MTFSTRFSGVATLALAVLPAFALAASAAHAQPQASVRVADLNLASAQGRAAFASRVDHAATRYCAGEKSLVQAAACKAAVRDEVNAKADGEIRFASRI